MFMLSYNFFFLCVLCVFSFVAINFSSLFFTWVFMELNMLVVIPLLLIKSSMNKEQPSTGLKYFMAQVIASLLILFSICFLSLTFNPGTMNSALFILALMMKAGIPPLHFWFPEVMKASNPMQGFVLVSIQKMIPLFLVALTISEIYLILVVAASMVGGVSGLSQNSMMKMLAYSSMGHSSWTLVALNLNTFMGYTYFAVYSYTSWCLLLCLYTSQVKFISELANTMNTSLMKILFSANILAMSGMPPFIGFFTKLSVILFLMKTKMAAVIAFLILGSTLSFFFYLRSMVSMGALNFKSPKASASGPNSMPVYSLVSLISLSAGSLTLLWMVG